MNLDPADPAWESEVVGSLADLVPAACSAIGHPLPPTDAMAAAGTEASVHQLRLPAATATVIVLIDGLGELLLARRGGHAPFLSRAPRQILTCGFPSTTATSLSMLGTATWPGEHGLVGTEVLDPATGVLFNELAWDSRIDPLLWQPRATAFERAVDAGVEVVRIGPAHFAGSGLTEAGLRGGRFVAAASLTSRIDAAVSVLRTTTSQPTLVYLYWGDLDKVGHVYGCESWQWGQHLEEIDAAIRNLVRRVGQQVSILVTADHGMVDIAMQDRIDLAHEPELASGVAWLGGDPRGVQLYCHPGAEADVYAAWQHQLGDRLAVRLRDEAIAEGWFGAVADRVRPRLGQVIASATTATAVVDSRRMRRELLALKGLHGAATREEQLVPLITFTG